MSSERFVDPPIPLPVVSPAKGGGDRTRRRPGDRFNEPQQHTATKLHRKGIKVNKIDLIAAVADKTDLTKAKAAEAVDAVFGAIEGALKAREEVRLVGFGSFATATRKAGTGRNPRTGEEIKIAASTSVKFKPGKALKDAVG